MPLLLFVAAGLIMIGLAIPMILRRVPPNPIYGLRVPATFADEWVWYEANARSGRDLLVLGTGLIVLAVGLPTLGLSENAYTLIWSAAAAIGAVGMGVVGWLRAKRLLWERTAR